MREEVVLLLCLAGDVVPGAHLRNHDGGHDAAERPGVDPVEDLLRVVRKGLFVDDADEDVGIQGSSVPLLPQLPLELERAYLLGLLVLEGLRELPGLCLSEDHLPVYL